MLDDARELIDLNNNKFIDYGEECCNLLNEQHETIQRLKQNIDELLFVNVEEELLNENERLKAQLNDREKRVTDKDVEWLRNNTVWEQMPSNKRTFTKTIYHRRNDE